jgi:hypothetical protein
MKLIYLASPYSKYPGGREAAYKEACSKAAELMQQVAIFCPIAHSHSIELEGMNGDIKDGDWWLKQDFAVLKRCDELWVYQMPGWEESYGVTKEIMFAVKNSIPIKMIPYVQSSIKVSAPVPNTVSSLSRSELTKRSTDAMGRLCSALKESCSCWGTVDTKLDRDTMTQGLKEYHNARDV